MQKQVAPATPKSLTDCLSAAFPGVTNYKAGDTQSATCRNTLMTSHPDVKPGGADVKPVFFHVKAGFFCRKPAR